MGLKLGWPEPGSSPKQVPLYEEVDQTRTRLERGPGPEDQTSAGSQTPSFGLAEVETNHRVDEKDDNAQFQSIN